jgi:uncharacterized coiled-coil DUF342 family protein
MSEYKISETDKKKLKEYEKKYRILTQLQTSLLNKHVYPSVETLNSEYNQHRISLADSIDTLNKKIKELTNERDKLVSEYDKLNNRDIKKVEKVLEEILFIRQKTRNKYTRNLKTLMHKRSQIRYKMSRLTHGRKLPQETDSPTLSVTISPPRKRSPSATRKKRSPSRKSKTSKKKP